MSSSPASESHVVAQLMVMGDTLTGRQPHDDYEDRGKKALHQTKWNAAPYIGNAIDAHLNPVPDYQDRLIQGIECYKTAMQMAPANSDARQMAGAAYSYKSQELRIFQRPIPELARIALYEARNSNQSEEYAQRWGALLLKQAKTDPLNTAYDLLRDAHNAPDDDIVSRTGAKVWGEIVTTLAVSPTPDGASLAIRLADKAQEWLDWSFNCHNDWGREKKRNAELTHQIAIVRSVAEPIVQQQAAAPTRSEETCSEEIVAGKSNLLRMQPRPQTGAVPNQFPIAS